jgi:hypothetical protein
MRHVVFRKTKDGKLSFYGRGCKIHEPKQIILIKSNFDDVEQLMFFLKGKEAQILQRDPDIYSKHCYPDQVFIPLTELQSAGFEMDYTPECKYININPFALSIEDLTRQMLVDVLEDTIACQLNTNNNYKRYMLECFVDSIWELARIIRTKLFFGGKKNVICRIDGIYKEYDESNGGDNKFRGFTHNFEYEIEDHIHFDTDYPCADFYKRIRVDAKVKNNLGERVNMPEDEIKLLFELPQLLVQTPYNSFNKLFFELVCWEQIRLNYSRKDFKDCEIIINGATIEVRKKDLNGKYSIIDETLLRSDDFNVADNFWNYYPDNMLRKSIVDIRW